MQPTGSFLSCSVLVAALSGSPSLVAQEVGPAVPPALGEAIDAAIDDGIRALLRQQELDGSWSYALDRYGSGATALCLYALLESGLPRTHPAVQRAVAFVRANPSDRTYAAAAHLLALTELGESEDRARIAAILETLVEEQQAGGFGYPSPEIDLSNTHLAAFGMRAAVLAGHRVPKKVWSRLAEAVLEHQEGVGDPDQPAGFFYRPRQPVTGSMTTAGVSALAVCREMGAGSRRIDAEIERGVAWLAREFRVDGNPGARRGFVNLHYYLFGLERVGALLERETFGEHPWYLRGAEFLVERQGAPAPGRWAGQDGTAFALLFLSRATGTRSGPRGDRDRGVVTDAAVSDVVLRASGDSPLVLWIEAFGEEARRAYVWPDEPTPRVARVEYWIDAGPGVAQAELLGVVEATSAQPRDGERYALRRALPRPGSYRVHASAVVTSPAGEELTLHSPELGVVVSQAAHPDLASYVTGAARNRLLGVAREVSASSALEARQPERAVDGRTGSSWLGLDGDPHPTLRIEAARAVRGNTLLLSHATDLAAAQPTHLARALRVAISINDARVPLEVELVQDDWRKTVIDLGSTQRVRSLEIRVLAASPGAGGRDGVGFAEVELQLR